MACLPSEWVGNGRKISATASTTFIICCFSHWKNGVQLGQIWKGNRVRGKWLQGLRHNTLLIHFCVPFNAIRVSSYSSTALSTASSSAGTPGPASLAYVASQCDVLQSHPVCVAISSSLCCNLIQFVECLRQPLNHSQITLRFDHNTSN